MNSQINKVLVLGSSGFVGRNISELFQSYFCVIKSVKDSTKVDDGSIWFDLLNENSWIEIIKLSPSVIINCIGYGVVKKQQDVNNIYTINYFKTIELFDFLSDFASTINIIHLGTAFEYDLSLIKLSEDSSTVPRTHYGVSKLMTSNYLFHKRFNFNFVVIRPFNMFGFYEDDSKILPSLILAQKKRVSINLTSGAQKRDFLFVDDLSNFLVSLIKNFDFSQIPRCINIGTGKSISIKKLSSIISGVLPHFDSKYWNWNAISQRNGETLEFYNASSLSRDLGFSTKDIATSLHDTVKYYWNL